MSLRLRIEGIGVVGGFGCGVGELAGCLEEGRRPEPTPRAAGRDAEATVPVLAADTSRLDEFLPKRRQRGLDSFSRLATLAAYLALEDAALLDAKRGSMGIVIASGYGSTASTFGFLDSILDGGTELASPALFARSLHNVAAAQVSILLGVTGPGLTVSQFDLSVPSALLSARQWLAEERVERVLFGGVDVYCTALGYSWSSRLHRPSGRAAGGTIPIGEGAFMMVLSRQGAKASRYGCIQEVAIGWDGFHRSRRGEGSVLLCGSPEADREGRRSSMDGARSFAPIYGCLPVGLGFDAAIAALGVARDRVFAPPAGDRDPVEGAEDLDGRVFCCLCRQRRGAWGMIHIGGR